MTKVVQLVDLDGFFIEDAIEENNSFNGIAKTYTYEVVEKDENEDENEVEDFETIEVHTGYKVGVPLIGSFYKPRFKVDVWEDYLNLLYIYESKYNAWANSGSEENEPEKVKREDFTFWVEGLTQEEIDALHPPIIKEKTEVELLQEELTNAQIALSDVYEQLLAAQDETTSVQEALVDVYEQLLFFIEGGSRNA